MRALQRLLYRRVRVTHQAQWVNAPLQYNAAGDTKPGFMCVHLLENGRGVCGANVYVLKQASGNCACIVYIARWRGQQWYEHRAR